MTETKPQPSQRSKAGWVAGCQLVGGKPGNITTIERGEPVTEKDVGGADEMKRLIATGAVKVGV